LVAGKMRVITAMVCGDIIDAPSPWNTLARISWSMSWVRPHHTDAIVKTVSPTRYRFFGPTRSPSRPVISSGTAYASRYALVTHTTSVTPACSDRMIAGVATVTMVESTRIMKKPRHSAHSAGQGWKSGSRDGSRRFVEAIRSMVSPAADTACRCPIHGYGALTRGIREYGARARRSGQVARAGTMAA
jgi:hypothetical protein